MPRMVCLFLVLALLAFWTSSNNRAELARQGQIDVSAPVQASLAIVIHAPPERIWRLLTDINSWPEWQPAIKTASLHGAVAPGATFTWKAGMRIDSTIALVDSGRRLAWTGSAGIAHAIHTWTIEPASDGNTLVKTNESMDGFLLTHFYSSRQLVESDQLWLDSLKLQAERAAESLQVQKP